ncbi:hypothetical protein PF008_g762 [Phytophthora fragariae]|uniref:Uncharacterized protein n=1 Tax=Phytophthora fragariae TaxID=53985 RepID=A0A6G0SMP9_9STRA|nr:hypothetical protein PF008_g762 [Phytophthora fragariae]
MSAAFGWTSSAGTYSVLSGVIAFIHGSTCDVDHPSGYFNYNWVDDHVNVASNVGTCCADVERSLRFAMTVVMGPVAVNKDKFTQWSTHQKVLGLMFDTSVSTVAMPAPNITKAKGLVAHAFHAAWISREQLRSLCRDVCPPGPGVSAASQRRRKTLHRRARVTITAHMRDDLVWWWDILGNPSLNGVPLEYFAFPPPEPDLTVTTDVSDEGLCAIIPGLRQTLTYQFSPSERTAIAAFKGGAPMTSATASCLHARSQSRRGRTAFPQGSSLHVLFPRGVPITSTFVSKIRRRSHGRLRWLRVTRELRS